MPGMSSLESVGGPREGQWADGQVEQTLTTSNFYNASPPNYRKESHVDCKKNHFSHSFGTGQSRAASGAPPGLIRYKEMASTILLTAE
jgi:hypothetical protein